MEKKNYKDFHRYISKMASNNRASRECNNADWTAFHYKISESYIKNLIDIAIEQQVVCLSDQAFYIYAIKMPSDYKSLIFLTNGHIIKSTESTSEIMVRYFRYKNSPYSVNSELGKLLDIHQKCPYLVEGQCFAPDGGSTRKDVSWIGLHHIHYIEAKGDQSVLKVWPYGEITLPVKIDRLNKMVENSCLMALMHQAIAHFVSKQYNFTTNQLAPENVITRQMNFLRHKFHLPNPIEIYHYMENQKVLHLLKTIMGIDFPTEREINELFPTLNSLKDCFGQINN